MAELKLIVVTPEETAFECQTTFVALPMHDGELGVAASHAPMIGRLGYGELRVKQGGGTTRYYIDGGFVQIADNVVSVLTNRAVPAGKLDGSVLEEELKSAIVAPAHSDEGLDARERAVSQARAQLRVARAK
ncbi:MAG: ATP synthase F1 subunit epsilon [Planctomycetales bacterium]|nr:ATP synthase F1 subunit epsilon [Planctomycetales bacterium]